jgi:hypothetical protein
MDNHGNLIQEETDLPYIDMASADDEERAMFQDIFHSELRIFADLLRKWAGHEKSNLLGTIDELLRSHDL